MNTMLFSIAFLFISIYFLLIGKKMDELNEILKNVQADIHIKNCYDAGLVGKEEYQKFLMAANEDWLDYYKMDKKVEKKGEKK